MAIRFKRAIIFATAVGAVLSGGAALAATPAPPIPIKWTESTAAPMGVTRLDGAVVDKKVYFLGFRAADASTDGSVWYYDLATKTYVDTGTDLPVPISNYSVAVLKDANGTGLYTFGGRDASGAIITTVQVYYPATNTASVVESDPWPGTTPAGCTSLPATGVAVVGNLGYVIGGISFSSAVPPCIDDQSSQVWAFDPKAADGAKWSERPSLNVARGYLATAVVGKTIYAIGGDINNAGTLVAQANVEAWKAGKGGSWDDASYSDLPVACDETQAFGFQKGQLGGTVTLAGCGQWPVALANVQQYDIATDTWSDLAPLNEARRNHLGVNIGSSKKPKLFLLGGYNSDGSVTLATSELGAKSKKSADQAAPQQRIPSVTQRLPLS